MLLLRKLKGILYFSLKWISVVLLTALPIVHPVIADSTTRYTSPEYGWSIVIPPDWNMDSFAPSAVNIYAPTNDGLCGIQAGQVRFETLEELVDFLLDYGDQLFQQRGLEQVVISRQTVEFENSYDGIDVTVEIRPGGKSRRMYFLQDGIGVIIDCETYEANWQNLEADFDRIMNSFVLQ